MSIKKIRVTNFKSFKDLEVELGNFNVLIGANASGKSNFVQIFKFLSDMANSGLDNAISMQGGVEYLGNINVGNSEKFSLRVVFDQKVRQLIQKNNKGLGLINIFQNAPFQSVGTEKGKGINFKNIIEVYEIIYEFALKFKGKQKGGRGFDIVKDSLVQKCGFIKVEGQTRKKIGEGEIILSVDSGKFKVNLQPEKAPIKIEDIYPSFIRKLQLPHSTLLLDLPFFLPPIAKSFSDISVYDFDPKLPKKATPITGKAELEEDGSNLSIILKNIAEDVDKRQTLFNLVKDLLPFISNLGVDQVMDKSLLFKLQETYFKKKNLPAPLISDGTINIIALIIALYFEKKTLTIIEEPERNIHPYLISKIVDMMKDASQKKQIIVTTHNPEVLKHAGLENILLVSRDKQGFSTVSRPGDKEEVKTFLENDIGIDDLYVQNLLGV